jgi:formiminotetrahydrofolate cyclodeaminase
MMEASLGRNFSTADWERDRKAFQSFSQSLDLSKGSEALHQFTHTEIQEPWHVVTEQSISK